MVSKRTRVSCELKPFFTEKSNWNLDEGRQLANTIVSSIITEAL